VKKIGIFILLALSIVSLGIVLKNYFFQDAAEKVVLLDWGEDKENFAKMLSMDKNGNKLQVIEYATGTIDWSKDGKYLITGCKDSSKICVYEPSNFLDWTKYPPQIPTNPDHIEVDLPEECRKVLSSNGVSSLSWSRNGKSFIVVCENGKQSNVCVENTNGIANCWGEKDGDDIYSRADWSPNEDLIVIDTGVQSYLMPSQVDDNVNIIQTGRKLQIVDLKGKFVNSLIDGWSPSWSPDGKEIAFFRWDDKTGYPGLASIHSDGSNFRWIYQTVKRGSDSNLEYYKPYFQDAFNCMGSSKITWSSDKKYIFMDASIENDCVFSIFRVEIKTGKIEDLMTNLSTLYKEPDVQP
jgi:WD40 repeat protein